MQQEKLARARADKRVVEVSVLDVDHHFDGEDMFFIKFKFSLYTSVKCVLWIEIFFCCLLPLW